ncbi:hypothetical protein K437DRAFT_253827 [Tilletiaria anomala UBC 951]|uniref:UBR-type domain-containing protein n=1 Tax=Tilletiaria anomala (strain ATCC 24038 / CBS 436.72 / UBC 951) TaxID=1037660 RepID=A0A066WQJ3_TILAU|nr:uncharacterized protein K437DRAFT_253827 [Tilletiaria anomala UBC 951]KDN52880.1 hypothetical protein K437DRAFT_253827 [Tilletiaria anomala UBC 951]
MSFSRSPSKSPTKRGAAAALLAGLPDPFLPAPELPEAERAFTASDLIARQAQLEAEAHAAIPFGLGSCTHSKGYIRQPVYACRTCGGGGVCAHCSLGCHADHELIELFAKRSFRCDCGTPGMFRQHPDGVPAEYPACTIRKPGYDPENDENIYSQNFDGRFCYCEKGKAYDPNVEDEAMFQCLACEEWFHEACTSLVPVLSNPTSAENGDQLSGASDSAQLGSGSAPLEVSRGAPLIEQDLFDMLICSDCVLNPKNSILLHYIGARGFSSVLPVEALSVANASASAPSTSLQDEKPVVSNSTPASASDVSLERQQGLRPKERDRLPITYIEFGGTSCPALQRKREIAIVGISPDVLFHGEEEAETSQGTVVAAAAEKEHPPTSSTAAPSSSAPANASTVDVVTVREKRKAEDDLGQGPQTGKKPKAEDKTDAETVSNHDTALSTRTGSCSLPPLINVVPSVLRDRKQGQPRYDIYLASNFRERICRCHTCLPRWSSLPFVLDEEETYSPPVSEASNASETAGSASNASTYDLGVAALSRLPRERLLETMGAYTRFRDELYAHLRPHAATGEVVTEASIREFFSKRL